MFLKLKGKKKVVVIKNIYFKVVNKTLIHKT